MLLCSSIATITILWRESNSDLCCKDDSETKCIYDRRTEIASVRRYLLLGVVHL